MIMIKKNKVARKFLFIAIFSTLAIFVFASNKLGVFTQDITHTQLTKTLVKINDVEIKVEIANTPEERMQGLGGRESLDEDEGMLFVFENSNNWGFWMKDMQFALDIIWINENFEIVHIEQNILPETFPAIYTSPIPAKYVLEVNDGFIDKHAIKIGSSVIL
jgi:uncharacterized membrane protein (UPF0127 family)